MNTNGLATGMMVIFRTPWTCYWTCTRMTKSTASISFTSTCICHNQWLIDLFRLSSIGVIMLEYVRALLGLGWLYSLLVLELIRDKGRLLRGQVNLSI
jgi:hypothetical protein